jgi:hypothetical protein
MSSERIRVKVLIPQQEFYFWYDEEDWNYAVENGETDWLMDYDLSGLDWRSEIYGPDGKLAGEW